MAEVVELRKQHNIKHNFTTDEMLKEYNIQYANAQKKLEDEKLNEINFKKSIAQLQQDLKEFE